MFQTCGGGVCSSSLVSFFLLCARRNLQYCCSSSATLHKLPNGNEPTCEERRPVLVMMLTTHIWPGLRTWCKRESAGGAGMAANCQLQQVPPGVPGAPSASICSSASVGGDPRTGSRKQQQYAGVISASLAVQCSAGQLQVGACYIQATAGFSLSGLLGQEPGVSGFNGPIRVAVNVFGLLIPSILRCAVFSYNF